ncbi:MAG: hypothetical protein K6G88_00530 [Lachnospiraceae bacterium]|nr:hypothetical protein [Lachnospiraceae bacterium]
MNIRFLAQSEYYNGIHLKDDIILEKEYEDGPFASVPKVRYYIYRLEDNERTEVCPLSDKVDAFSIFECAYRSDCIYFTEYDDQYDGTYHFNIMRYNYVEDKLEKLITLKDNMEYYPYNKQIKIFILDDANLIVQRAIKRRNLQDNYEGFFDFTLILFNYRENRQTLIADENLKLNGIDYILPFTNNTCIMKTGFSLLEENRHALLSKEEASIESLILVNISQFVSDLLLEQPSMITQTIDHAFYDETISSARIVDNYLIYSKVNFENKEEKVVFQNLSTRESMECINQNVASDKKLAKTYIINGQPHIRIDKEDKIEFFNLETKEVSISFGSNTDIVYVNNNLFVSATEKHVLGKVKHYLNIHQFPSHEIVMTEKGEFLGAVASDDDTSYIFLK